MCTQPSKFASALCNCRCKCRGKLRFSIVCLGKKMPRQFHPLYLKLQRLFVFCLNLQTTVFVFCITSLFELLSSTSGEQQKISFLFKFELFSVGFGWNKEQPWWFNLKTARRETLFYLLDCRVITVKFILSYDLLLITTNFLKTFWSQELPTWMPKGAEVIAEGI